MDEKSTLSPTWRTTDKVSWSAGICKNVVVGLTKIPWDHEVFLFFFQRLHKTAWPTPMVWPLDESQGSSPLQGHGSWLVREVAHSCWNPSSGLNISWCIQGSVLWEAWTPMLGYGHSQCPYSCWTMLHSVFVEHAILYLLPSGHRTSTTTITVMG